MSDIVLDKKELRKEMSHLRSAISVEEMKKAQEQVIKHLKESSFYKEEYFYPFVSYKKEFPTHLLIEELLKDGKTVAVPKVMGEEMEFFQIHSLDDCQPGCMGILEPKEGCIPINQKGIVIVPGLAFDKKGGRMGYGAGFYDKYFARYPQHTKIALLYDFQLIDEVPMEEHDLPMDYLLSPSLAMEPCR